MDLTAIWDWNIYAIVFLSLLCLNIILFAIYFYKRFFVVDYNEGGGQWDF